MGTPLYSAARDDRASAVAALLALRALSNEDGSERGKHQGSSQRSWTPATTGLLSGALMGYGGA